MKLGKVGQHRFKMLYLRIVLMQVNQGMALSTRADVIFEVFRRHLRLVPMIL